MASRAASSPSLSLHPRPAGLQFKSRRRLTETPISSLTSSLLPKEQKKSLTSPNPKKETPNSSDRRTFCSVSTSITSRSKSLPRYCFCRVCPPQISPQTCTYTKKYKTLESRKIWHFFQHIRRFFYIFFLTTRKKRKHCFIGRTQKKRKKHTHTHTLTTCSQQRPCLVTHALMNITKIYICLYSIA